MELNNYHIQIPQCLQEATKKNTAVHVRKHANTSVLLRICTFTKKVQLALHLPCHSNVMYRGIV